MMTPAAHPQRRAIAGRTAFTLLGWGLLLVACVGVFIGIFQAYLSPEFLVRMADQWWGCF